MRLLRTRLWIFISGGWLGAAAFTVAMESTRRGTGGSASVSVWELLHGSNGGGYLALTLMAPAVVAVSSRWPLRDGRIWGTAGVHVVSALLFWGGVAAFQQGVFAYLAARGSAAGLPAAGPELFRQLGSQVLAFAVGALPLGLAVYVSIVGIEHGVRHFVEAREREVQMARLSEQLAGARLAALESQLSPHFLFNTLNLVAVRARDGDRASTVRMVELLSDLLRRTLDRHRASEVALEEEMGVVEGYLAIEQQRFPDRLRPELAIDEGARLAVVPSFAVQHLVENALRHGIAMRAGAGGLRVAAAVSGDVLEVSVSDDGPGLAGDDGDLPADGGIESTRERLRVMYGDRASLTLEERVPAPGTTATLRVPRITVSERG